jgi:hypothetical protein
MGFDGDRFKRSDRTFKNLLNAEILLSLHSQAGLSPAGISLSRSLRQRLNLHRHIFSRALAFDGQPHLLPNRRQPDQVAHLGCAADRDVIGLQDDIAPLQTRALRRRTGRNLGDPRAFQVTGQKPMPTLPPAGETIAVLIPTSSPFRSIQPPPELPGLMAASVWMKSS